MKHIRQIAGISLLVILGATTVPATSAKAESFMTGDELKNTLVGKSLSGLTTKDIPFTQVILAGKPGKNKGNIEGMQEGSAYQSEWKIKGNKWCEAWPGGSACWRIMKIDDKTVQAYKGKKKLDHVWKLSSP